MYLYLPSIPAGASKHAAQQMLVGANPPHTALPTRPLKQQGAKAKNVVANIGIPKHHQTW